MLYPILPIFLTATLKAPVTVLGPIITILLFKSVNDNLRIIFLSCFWSCPADSLSLVPLSSLRSLYGFDRRGG
ncbi:MAG: hypothetical protein V2A65_08395 [Candidatus Omnitrophota bacterium]